MDATELENKLLEPKNIKKAAKVYAVVFACKYKIMTFRDAVKILKGINLE